jgi:hypothetical protein
MSENSFEDAFKKALSPPLVGIHARFGLAVASHAGIEKLLIPLLLAIEGARSRSPVLQEHQARAAVLEKVSQADRIKELERTRLINKTLITRLREANKARNKLVHDASFLQLTEREDEKKGVAFSKRCELAALVHSALIEDLMLLVGYRKGMKEIDDVSFQTALQHLVGTQFRVRGQKMHLW